MFQVWAHRSTETCTTTYQPSALASSVSGLSPLRTGPFKPLALGNLGTVMRYLMTGNVKRVASDLNSTLTCLTYIG